VEIVIGTANPSKVRQCQLALRSSHLRVRPLSEMLADPPEVVEDGRASDDQLLDYYGRLFASYGGRIRGHWQAGAAVATPAGRVERTTIPVDRTFVSQPNARRREGYPLASLQLAHGDTYISQLSDREEEQLWQRVLGKPLHDLVAGALGRLRHRAGT
jgi:hypothetical protein